MPYKYVKIAGTGSYLPERIVSNDDLAKTLDTSDEWIFSHTGIRNRHIAAPEQTPVDLAYEAARKALQDAQISAEDLGMILLSTSTGDYFYLPSTACLLQEKLSAVNAAAIDTLAACTGFVYNLELARCWALANKKPVLLVASEMLSRVTDWNSRETCILFGDGAAATVLVLSKENGFLYSTLGADGSKAQLLTIEGGCRLPREEMPESAGLIQMQGRAVFSVAVRAIEQVILKILAENNLSLDQVAHIVPHQANLRILETVAKRLNVSIDKFRVNIDQTANTSSASIPILLDELKQQGKLNKGDYILTVAFGGGLTFGGNLLRWFP